MNRACLWVSHNALLGNPGKICIVGMLLTCTIRKVFASVQANTCIYQLNEVNLIVWLTSNTCMSDQIHIETGNHSLDHTQRGSCWQKYPEICLGEKALWQMKLLLATKNVWGYNSWYETFCLKIGDWIRVNSERVCSLLFSITTITIILYYYH